MKLINLLWLLIFFGCSNETKEASQIKTDLPKDCKICRFVVDDEWRLVRTSVVEVNGSGERVLMFALESDNSNDQYIKFDKKGKFLYNKTKIGKWRVKNGNISISGDKECFLDLNAEYSFKLWTGISFDLVKPYYDKSNLEEPAMFIEYNFVNKTYLDSVNKLSPDPDF